MVFRKAKTTYFQRKLSPVGTGPGLTDHQCRKATGPVATDPGLSCHTSPLELFWHFEYMQGRSWHFIVDRTEIEWYFGMVFISCKCRCPLAAYTKEDRDLHLLRTNFVCETLILPLLRPFSRTERAPATQPTGILRLTLANAFGPIK